MDDQLARKLAEMVLRQAGVSPTKLSFTFYFGKLCIETPTLHGWEKIVRTARKLLEAPDD